MPNGRNVQEHMQIVKIYKNLAFDYKIQSTNTIYFMI
jgi:hypothetical protein